MSRRNRKRSWFDQKELGDEIERGTMELVLILLEQVAFDCLIIQDECDWDTKSVWGNGSMVNGVSLCVIVVDDDAMKKDTPEKRGATDGRTDGDLNDGNFL